jgi:hypothetical protein
MDAPMKDRITQLLSTEDDEDAFKRLAHAGAKMLEKFDAAGIPSNLLFKFVFTPHGKYMDECNEFAVLATVPPRIMAALQRLFSLSKLMPSRTPIEPGCTAAAYFQPGNGMYLARCLDWAKPGQFMGPATRVVEYRRQGQLQYKAVQILGMTGHLSILKPGRFAAVINWAPETGLPGFQTEPTHRLREIAEDPGIDSYDAAVKALRKANKTISADAFFTVVGTESSQMCVIERQGSTGWSHVRKPLPGSRYLVQTNHYDPEGEFKRHPGNWVEDTLPKGSDGYDLSTQETTKVRQAVMTEAISALAQPSDPVATLHACLNRVPVRNAHTRQQMVFHIASGEIHAWRELTNSPTTREPS